jgi:hypothetical protein
MNQLHWLSAAVYETVKWQLKMTNSGIFLGREGHQLGHDSESLKRDEIVEGMLDLDWQPLAVTET